MKQMDAPEGDIEVLNLVIWPAASRDEADLIRFFHAHSTAHNKARGDDVLIEMISNRCLLHIEEEKKGTCGVAAMIMHPREDEEKSYSEMGATVITTNGLRLQVVTLWIRALTSFINSGPTCEIFSAAHKDNVVSIHNLQKAGFEHWDNPPKWLKDEKLNKNPELMIFHITKEGLTEAAENLLALDKEGKIDRRPKKKKIAYLAVRVPVLTDWKEYTENIAKGDFDFFGS